MRLPLYVINAILLYRGDITSRSPGQVGLVRVRIYAARLKTVWLYYGNPQEDMHSRISKYRRIIE